MALGAPCAGVWDGSDKSGASLAPGESAPSSVLLRNDFWGQRKAAMNVVTMALRHHRWQSRFLANRYILKQFSLKSKVSTFTKANSFSRQNIDYCVFRYTHRSGSVSLPPLEALRKNSSQIESQQNHVLSRELFDFVFWTVRQLQQSCRDHPFAQCSSAEVTLQGLLSWQQRVDQNLPRQRSFNLCMLWRAINFHAVVYFNKDGASARELLSWF